MILNYLNKMFIFYFRGNYASDRRTDTDKLMFLDPILTGYGISTEI